MEEDIYSLPNFLTNPPVWAIVMVSGGHFAGAVFEGSTVLSHKTFHSYTVRAKQGGSQGAQDSKSGTSHPKSAGASLRRYNEASFTQHIQELLESWKDKLNRCSVIFYRAASSSLNSLFGGKNPPLQRNNPRTRHIPFPSMRPTFKEIKRVHSILSGVHVYGIRDEFIAKHLTPKTKPEDSTKTKRSKRKKGNVDRAKSRSPVKRDEPERPLSSPDVGSDVDFTIEEYDQEINFSHLEEYGSSLTKEEIESRKQLGRNRKSKPKKNKNEDFPNPIGIIGDMTIGIFNSDLSQLDEQLKILKQESETRKTDSSFTCELNQLINTQSFTVLHLAATKDLQNAIWILLECGCDPTIKDKSGKYPYNYAETKESRMVFRKFRGQYPEKYNYDKAQIPVPLSEEQEQEKQEKKRALNKLKREKEKIKKLEKKEKEKEADEKDRFLNLSDREKRALAAERRILGTCKANKEKAPILIRCFECATDITGKVPFEYNQNVF